jgi:hypothetical protein
MGVGGNKLCNRHQRLVPAPPWTSSLDNRGGGGGGSGVAAAERIAANSRPVTQ